MPRTRRARREGGPRRRPPWPALVAVVVVPLAFLVLAAVLLAHH